MVLKPISPACKVEAFVDDDGTRLICNTVIEEDCPLGHAGVLGPDCFAMSMSSGEGGSPLADAPPRSPGISNTTGAPESISSEDVPRPARHKRRRVARYGEMVMVNEDENMFEVEEPQPPTPPKKEPEPEPEDEDDDDDDGFFEPLVEEFESLNGYSFGLTLLKDEDDEFFIDMQLDNVTVQLPVQDFMEMMSAFANALTGIGKAMTR